MKYITFLDGSTNDLPVDIKKCISHGNYRFGLIIDIIEKLYPINLGTMTKDAHEYFKSGNLYIRFANKPNIIYFAGTSHSHGRCSIIKINDIDICRPWTLGRSGDTEEVFYIDDENLIENKYISEFTCINHIVNQYKISYNKIHL